MADNPPYLVRHHPELEKDLAGVPRNIALRILRAFDERLAQEPARYGERLKRSLKGYWKLRVGDYRAVFEIVGREVRVYGVMDRREVYDRILRRLGTWR